jgi:hypothetical protein
MNIELQYLLIQLSSRYSEQLYSIGSISSHSLNDTCMILYQLSSTVPEAKLLVWRLTNERSVGYGKAYNRHENNVTSDPHNAMRC